MEQRAAKLSTRTRFAWLLHALGGEAMLMAALAVVIAAMSILSPYFLTFDNILQSMRVMSEVGLVALGMTMVMIARGIDLSVGSNIALTGVFCGMMFQAGFDIWPIAALGLAIGTMLGAINGLLVTLLRLPPIIVTIATLAVYHGLALGTSGAQPFGVPEAFYFLGQGYVGTVPTQLVFFVVVVLVLIFLLTRTTFGRTLSAIGFNETAARFAGLRVDGCKLLVYTLSGFLAGLASLIYISRVASAREDAGVGIELDAVAIAVLGGAAVGGGRGSIAGTLIAILIVGFLRNGLALGFITAEIQSIFIGAILIVAVSINELRRRMTGGRDQ